MRRAAPVAVAAALAVPAAADAATRLGGGALHALSADRTSAFAVIDGRDESRPLSLVRSTGGRARSAVSFGERGAEFVDLAYDVDGMVVTWGRQASAGEHWFLAPVADLADFRWIGRGGGFARVAVAGDTRWVTGPDRFGDAALIAVTAGLTAHAPVKLTRNGPYEAHLPLDIAIGPDDQPLVLDLAQTGRRTSLRVRGNGAPSRAVFSRRGVRHSRGTIAVSGRRIRVAYQHKGRAYLATASARRGARWRTRRLPGAGRGHGRAAVTDAGHVVYTQRGIGRRDVYFWDGRRARRLTATSTDERDVMVARARDGRVYAGWTRVNVRTGRRHAIIQRVR